MSLRARNPRAALATVVAEGFFGRLAFGMVSFGLPLYALSLGMSLGQIGILVSLRTIFVLPLKPVAGWLSDHIGVRAVYLSGALARTLAAALLLVAEGFVGLVAVRFLQGTSAAGRDVASLGVIVRDAQNSVGSTYSWYSSAKHVGGVAGAGIAGLLLSATGSSFTILFSVVLALSVLPTIAAWVGLSEVRDEREEAEPEEIERAESEPSEGRRVSSWLVAEFSVLREIAGPASVGMLVAASAYIVHGLFPVLATEYAGLSDAQAGLIYSLSAAVFLVSGPAFGYIVDRRGRTLGIAWRSAANVGSSFLYLLFPSFLGLAAARSVDDSGKAAFKPAWASAVAEISAADPKRRGKRLGALDTSQTLGEAIGPALAGLLWQTGGVFALFATRIVIALAAEVAALRVFGEGKWFRPRPSARLTTACYILPALLGIAGAAGWVGYVSGWGATAPSLVSLVGAGGVALAGILGGALAGRAAHSAERRAAEREVDQLLSDLAHDLRGPLTVIRGEVDLVLGREDVGGEERGRSGAAVVDEVERVEEILRRRREGRGS